MLAKSPVNFIMMGKPEIIWPIQYIGLDKSPQLIWALALRNIDSSHKFRFHHTLRTTTFFLDARAAVGLDGGLFWLLRFDGLPPGAAREAREPG